MPSKVKFDCVARLGGVELLLEPPRLLCEGVHLRLARGKLTVFCTDISARHLQIKLLQKLPSPHKNQVEPGEKYSLDLSLLTPFLNIFLWLP